MQQYLQKSRPDIYLRGGYFCGRTYFYSKFFCQVKQQATSNDISQINLAYNGLIWLKYQCLLFQLVKKNFWVMRHTKASLFLKPGCVFTFVTSHQGSNKQTKVNYIYFLLEELDHEQNFSGGTKSFVSKAQKMNQFH